jgi:hypothetical protein
VFRGLKEVGAGGDLSVESGPPSRCAGPAEADDVPVAISEGAYLLSDVEEATALLVLVLELEVVERGQSDLKPGLLAVSEDLLPSSTSRALEMHTTISWAR